MTPLSTVSIAPLLLCAALAAAAAPGQETSTMPEVATPLAELKRQYLVCDEAASRRVLGSGEAALCSVVSERLLREAFGGAFDALLSWWREAKPAFAAGRVRAERS